MNKLVNPCKGYEGAFKIRYIIAPSGKRIGAIEREMDGSWRMYDSRGHAFYMWTYLDAVREAKLLQERS